MNSKIILEYLNQANQDHLIEIKIFNKPIELIKKHITYEIKDKTIIIKNNFDNELYLLNVNSIKSIRFIAPKKFGMSWYGEKTAKGDNKIKMSI